MYIFKNYISYFVCLDLLLILKIMFKNSTLTISINYWLIAKTAYSNEIKKYRIKQQFKAFFLALLHPDFAKSWLKDLKSKDMQEIILKRPRLFVKPLRPYLSIEWSYKQRKKVILDTYRFFKSNKILMEFIQKDLILSEFLLKNGEKGMIVLRYDDRFRKEGELVISLIIDSLNGVVSSIAFSFEDIGNDFWICRIGCLQGSPQINGSYITKEVQKLLYGLRPNSLIFQGLQKFVEELGIKKIYGVSDQVQAQKKKHFIHIPWVHTINFSYNNLWEEIGGEYQVSEPKYDLILFLINHKKYENKGWYKLPLKTIRKQKEEIKSHKRAYYKKRYELLDFIFIDIKKKHCNLLTDSTQ